MADAPVRDALMARWTDFGPVFVVTLATHIEYWRWRGWFLLADSRDIVHADVEDVRREEERRWWNRW
jgi:hypothetical protein